jgi:hypothetical protein
VDSYFVRAFKERGLDTSERDLINMSIHNVDPSFIDDMNEFGYSDLRARDLIEMSIHGVDVDFVRRMKKMDIEDLSIKKLLQLKIHGIFD